MFIIKTATGLYLRWDNDIWGWVYEDTIEKAQLFPTLNTAKANKQGDERIFSVLITEGFVQDV